MVTSRNPRLKAIDLLSGTLEGKSNLSEILDKSSDPGAADPRDAAFARHLAYGVLRWLGALEWLAKQLLDRPLKRRDQDVHRLILLGLFQLWKDESAQHAAVNETAECARRVGKPWAVGVINAVLRRFQREKADWLSRLEDRPERFAHPGWLIDRLRSDFPEDWEAVLAANNRHAGMWLRVNRARTMPGEVAEAFRREDRSTRRHEHAADAIEVVEPAPVEHLPGFSEGLWSVQDPAAQLSVDWLDAQPGHRVLDACAAPGGKTCHILERTPDAHVVALDRSEARLRRLVDNAERLGLSDPDRLRVITADAQHPDGWWDGTPFDRILLDAPCTATGVIRRHPEIKWLRTPQQVEEAVSRQAALLRSLWPLLKAGGILVYATCSVLRDENSEQIWRFTKFHGDARPEDREVAYGRPCDSREHLGRQILPGEADMDGFFYARIRKTS